MCSCRTARRRWSAYPWDVRLSSPPRRESSKATVRIYVAKSGDPRKGADLLIQEPDAVGRSFNVDGHEIRLEGGTDTAANVILGMGDGETSIALSREADPSKIDVSTLSFEGTAPFTDNVRGVSKP